MKFRTEINEDPSPIRINYSDPVLLIGSCFTENIGRRMTERLFQVVINPFGVVYNPLSVKRSLDLIITLKTYQPDDLVLFNDEWISWDHHSSFSGPDRNEVLDHINENLENSSEFLKKASRIFISLGTARVYRLRRTGNVVCNCHKVPAKEFTRELLEIDTITDAYSGLIESLLQFNPSLKIIFTVSPVRHWKDGAHGNQLSKSILHLAADRIISAHPEVCGYFPSYEILLDDLRDYRFYDKDLLHPSEQAIDYLWEKFTGCYFDRETIKIMAEIEDIVKASQHRFKDPQSAASKKFLLKQMQKLENLKIKMPYLNWEELSTRFQVFEN